MTAQNENEAAAVRALGDTNPDRAGTVVREGWLYLWAKWGDIRQMVKTTGTMDDAVEAMREWHKERIAGSDTAH